MLREELILGVLSLFVFKIFPSNEELSKIDLKELENQDFDEKDLFSFIDGLILIVKGLLNNIFIF
jgi:hypothetical protein